MTSLQERLFAMQDKQYAAFSKKKKERSILATDLGLSLICLIYNKVTQVSDLPCNMFIHDRFLIVGHQIRAVFIEQIRQW